MEKMDITQLKKLIKDNLKYIITGIIIISSIVGFSIHVKNLDYKIAAKLVNNDLLTRSIDEENYIINHELTFDENKLKENLNELLQANNLNVKTNVIVKENKVTIVIGKEKLNFEIRSNIIK